MSSFDIQTLEEYERLNSWMLTRYDDVLAATRDLRFASDRASVNMSALPAGERPRYRLLGEHVSNWLGFTDPPKHTRMRNLVSKTFTSVLAENKREFIQQTADKLIDTLIWNTKLMHPRVGTGGKPKQKRARQPALCIGSKFRP